MIALAACVAVCAVMVAAYAARALIAWHRHVSVLERAGEARAQQSAIYLRAARDRAAAIAAQRAREQQLVNELRAERRAREAAMPRFGLPVSESGNRKQRRAAAAVARRSR